ncbi:MAG: hypothetical protein AAGI01_18720, partial [Myxococcota bacterium]
MHPDLYSDTKSFDWSALVLRASVVCSALMIFGSLVFRMVADMKTASSLREHGVQTCVELNRPPGSAAQPDAPTSFESLCNGIVAERHDDCVGESLREQSAKKR